MKIQRIIHQQVCQLKWQLLACFGLIMILPIEEAVVNFRDGLGFHCGTMVIVSAMIAPLLAGLIACANVQCDMDQKRYIFWRSKPAGIKLLVSLKFFVGLIASLIIILCPLIFWFLSGSIIKTNSEEIIYPFTLIVLLAIMTYSLCFGCNVLIRSTARAWLVGMLLAGFCLILPFMLPMHYKDFISDILFGSWVYNTTMMLTVSAAAFIAALFAAQYDWHLKTNLKGLIWVAGGLVFVLLMFFNSQVANIKVLQELEIESLYDGRNSLDSAGDRIIYKSRSYIDIDNNKILFSNIKGSPNDIPNPITRPEELEKYHIGGYPGSGKLIKVVGDNLYSYSIIAYFLRERTDREGKSPIINDIYEYVYLRSYKYTINSWTPVCELDLSDCIAKKSQLQIEMRLIDNKIITFIDNSFVIVDATNPIELKTIDKKLNVFKNRWGYYRESREEFSIPLLPTDKISREDRIKLSIDWHMKDIRYYNYMQRNPMENSIVDIHDKNIYFYLISHGDIVRYEVTDSDHENIYCQLKTRRPLTTLEANLGDIYSPDVFVKDGKLYCPGFHALMVFDVRSGNRIRKLGHFVRMDYYIEDIEILNDGRILLCLHWEHNLRIKDWDNPERKRYLCLLENPE